MKKIVFGITSLGIGGAERVLVDLVNKLQEEYEITIFTLYKGGAFEKELNPSMPKDLLIYDLYTSLAPFFERDLSYFLASDEEKYLQY